MKIKNGYMLRNVANTHIVVPVEDRVIDFKGMIVLNDISAAIWEFLQEDRQYDEIIDFILSEYDTDAQTAKKDLDALFEKMKENKLIDL